jgi:hypothetical protein
MARESACSTPGPMNLRVELAFDPLRGHARFDALMRFA